MKLLILTGSLMILMVSQSFALDISGLQSSTGGGRRCAQAHMAARVAQVSSSARMVAAQILDAQMRGYENAIHDLTVPILQTIFNEARPNEGLKPAKLTIEALNQFRISSDRREPSQRMQTKLDRILRDDPFFGTSAAVREALAFYMMSYPGKKDYLPVDAAIIISIASHIELAPTTISKIDKLVANLKQKWVVEQYLDAVNTRDRENLFVWGRGERSFADVRRRMHEFRAEMINKFGQKVTFQSFMQLSRILNRHDAKDFQIMKRMAHLMAFVHQETSAEQMAAHSHVGILKMNLRIIAESMGLQRDYPLLSFFDHFKLAQSGLNYEEFLIKAFAGDSYQKFAVMSDMVQLIEAIQGGTLKDLINRRVDDTSFGY